MLISYALLPSLQNCPTLILQGEEEKQILLSILGTLHKSPLTGALYVLLRDNAISLLLIAILVFTRQAKWSGYGGIMGLTDGQKDEPRDKLTDGWG